MDLKAQYLSETCSDPIEFLRQLRQTTEPIGGSTIYDKDGELVEYDIAIEAVRKANKTFIGKAWDWIDDNLLSSNQQDKSRLYCEQFRNYMKGE